MSNRLLSHGAMRPCYGDVLHGYAWYAKVANRAGLIDLRAPATLDVPTDVARRFAADVLAACDAAEGSQS